MNSMDWASISNSKLSDSLRLKNLIYSQISKNKERLSEDPLNACNSLRSLFQMLEIINKEIEEKSKCSEKVKIRYFKCHKESKKVKSILTKKSNFFSRIKSIPKYLQDIDQNVVEKKMSNNYVDTNNKIVDDSKSHVFENNLCLSETKSQTDLVDDLESNFSLKSLNQMNQIISNYDKHQMFNKDKEFYIGDTKLLDNKRKKSVINENIFEKNYYDYNSEEENNESDYYNKTLILKENILRDENEMKLTKKTVILNNELLFAQYNIPINEEINLD